MGRWIAVAVLVSAIAMASGHICKKKSAHYTDQGFPALWEDEQPKTVEGRIVHGTIVRRIKRLPHIVSIALRHARNNKSPESICAGTILSPTWIATACHCLFNSRVVAGISAGIIDKYSPVAEHPALNRVVLHPKYNHSIKDYDVCLLQLKAALTFNRRVGAVQRLANAGEEQEVGTMATIAGWGLTSEHGQESRLLRAARIPKQSIEDCRSSTDPHLVVTDRMVCYGAWDENSPDACRGDSGAPLTVDGPSGPILVGLASWGEGCARQNKTGIYAKIANAEIREFIRNATGI